MQSSGCNLFGRLPGEHGTLSTMPGRNHGQPYHVGRPSSMGIRHRNNTRQHQAHVPRPPRPHRQRPSLPPTWPKKAPTRAFLMWGLLSYSVTSFTISSAVFPSGAFMNFAFDKLRFISSIRVCISSTILPIPRSILFSLSKTAKQ